MTPEMAIRRALELAERGRYSTSPNPRVGCVVVDGSGEVAGEGFHERAGGPHAEVAALEKAGARARGGTLFVNLEPCAHEGRTPPCADAVIRAGVKRVICSIEDPDPRTAGDGIRRLREAGLEVEVGAEADAARRLNEVFLISVAKRRPFVHLKWAASLDGKIASRTGASRWITGEEARADSMRLREECDAVVVGAGTVLADDPALTRRAGLNGSIVPHRRIVLDGRLRVSPDARVFDRSDSWLVTAHPERAAEFRARGVTVEPLTTLGALLKRLQALDVRSLLVEGGGVTAWSFLKAGLVDRVTAYVAPKLIGGAGAPSPLSGDGFDDVNAAPRLVSIEVETLGADIRLSGLVG